MKIQIDLGIVTKPDYTIHDLCERFNQLIGHSFCTVTGAESIGFPGCANTSIHGKLLGLLFILASLEPRKYRFYVGVRENSHYPIDLCATDNKSIQFIMQSLSQIDNLSEFNMSVS